MSTRQVHMSHVVFSHALVSVSMSSSGHGMSVYVYIYIDVCIYTYVYIPTHVHIHKQMHVYMCEHLPVSRVVMYSISLLVCFACMYRACRSATYWIKRRLESYRSYRSLKSATSPIL